MGASAETGQDFIRQLDREIASISSHLGELRDFWARALGVTGPQLRIVLALAEMDDGSGIAVKLVSKMLHVEPSFVTTQSKILERSGFVSRTPSNEDGRIVKLSLTEKTWEHLASLASPREKLNDFILADFGPHDLKELTSKLCLLKRRLERACLKVAAEF
jgi:MarR family transcriptional regulator, organic hydroperoxide resistance regulator